METSYIFATTLSSLFILIPLSSALPGIYGSFLSPAIPADAFMFIKSALERVVDLYQHFKVAIGQTGKQFLRIRGQLCGQCPRREAQTPPCTFRSTNCEE
jgi:hypothetical protein